ncbi:CHAP domain-containing protein [Nocardioides jiangxiensis]|uniref:CHAP domain-containing protein n=1 Tax=Nocardioides jiangxiensis TaxID=3064524 RepID=A0ABT9B3X0_9ACTN|nr:CHAP domain-containing protein [Nocardioides sp. WY-20]MDO7869408.1 CHAP domain-containing protein [Nocardioides sp. WY-20]
MHRIRTMALTASVATVASLFAATAAPAQAATARNGVCETGEFCYSYNSDFAGSVSDHGTRLGDYGSTTPSCYTFRTPGKAGYGQCVKNNAASVWNRTSQTIRVYYNSNYSGAYVDVAAGVKRNLAGTALYNQNASHGPKPSTVGTTYPATNNYPYKGATSGVDPWNFYKGQCTSWAAWAVRDRLGVAFSNSYKGQHWGNANHWDDAARAAGIPVYSTPRAGDVAVRNSGTYGHVAFVRAVYSDGSFVIEEYNHVSPNTYSTRRTTRGEGADQFSAFIRLK